MKTTILVLSLLLSACGKLPIEAKPHAVCACPCVNTQACESFNGVSSSVACVLPNGITLNPNDQTDYGCK